jgi:transposase
LLDLIPRGERRRRWTIEQKQMIAAQSLAPGASPTEVARQHGISTGQLYTWRRALIAAQPAVAARTPGRFARVDVAPPVATQMAPGSALAASAPAIPVGAKPHPPGLIEIVLSDGTTLRVDVQIDARVLRRLVSAVRP